MDSLRIGIISDNRKLRFAYRTLVSEESQGAVFLAVEGISLNELGSWHIGGTMLDIILLDYRNVYADQGLFFGNIREIFPNSLILLMIDDACFDRMSYLVQGTIPQKCTFRQLWMTMKEMLSRPANFSKQIGANLP